jgi:TonB family protein
MLRAARFALCLMLTCTFPSALLQAGDLEHLESELRAEYCGRVTTLRSFRSGGTLDFDSLGTALTNSKPDSWTISGEIEVTDLHLHNDQLQLRGKRLFLVYRGNRTFVTLFPVSAQVGNGLQITGTFEGKFKKLEKRRDVTITIHLQPGMTEDSIRDMLKKVVAGPDENISELVPYCWKFFLEGGEAKFPKPQGVFGPRDGVSPPHARYTPEPQYPALARAAMFQGLSVLRLIVDPTGKPTDIGIVIPLGLGLDDKAVEAVSQWRFDPAKKDGKPVAARINVEVTFRLE